MIDIIVVFLILSFLALVIVKLDTPSKERKIHHDNRPGSHYYESQRALRDARSDYENGRGRS